MFSEEQKIGLSGERWVYNQLKRRGYKPMIMPDFQTRNCDLKIGSTPIEVKTANKTFRRRKDKLYPRWQWLIHNTARRHSEVDWILILLAEHHGQKYPYILPGNLPVFNDRFHLQITSHPLKYQGWLNAFLERWQVVQFITQRQLFPLQMSIEQWERSVA